MTDNTCAVCTGEIPKVKGRGRPRKYCSTKCQRWAAKHMNPRRCSVEGCTRPHASRGLCQTHYNQRYYPKRHAKAEVPCTVCGQVVLKYANGKRYRPVCSIRCRTILVGGTPRSRELVGPIETPTLDAPPVEVTVVVGPRVKWVAGDCQWCGDRFVKRTTSSIPRCCSDRCAAKWHKAKASAAKGRFAISPVRRRRLYERDNWTCQICLEPIDRDANYLDDWAPSLDHIEPQSHALIPDHSDDNLRTAHRWCNAVRGNLSHYADADLVA